MTPQKTVCVVGTWHLGVVNAVGFAEQEYRVIGLEFDKRNVKDLKAGKPPLYEPGLQELMHKRMHSGHLLFSDDPAEVRCADFVVIAYDSPVNERDEVTIEPIIKAANIIAPHLQPHTPVVITSQLPLGSSEMIEKNIEAANRNWKSGVVYTPENIKLGDTINRFIKPDMLIFGTRNPHAKRAVSILYRPFRTRKMWTDLRTAEMVKHALNAYLATSISFINEIAHISDQLGADAITVGQALKLDKRIGKKALLTPGLGFSGGTLARDVKQLQAFARKLHYDAKLLDAVTSVNDATFDRVVTKLQQVLGTLTKKNIGILGLTYKPNTSTLRRSPAIMMMQKLARSNAHCFGYDPMADQQEVRQYKNLVTRVANAKELAKHSDALVLITEWQEFQELSYNTLARQMRQPIMIDTKNALDPHVLTKAGFTYIGFGRHGDTKTQ